MRTADDPRHKRRQELVQELFKKDFYDQPILPQAQEIVDHLSTIDDAIQQAAKEFPIAKINKIDLAILRLAVYEMIITKKEPTNVIIDEAIELSKEFAGPTSPSFINGALGNIIKNENLSKIS